MKFVVDELPYYGEFCPFWEMCYDSGSDDKCPQQWNKYKICSDNNPHECRFLIEACSVKSEEPEQESNHSDGRCCKTCKHCREPGAIYICATCYKFSNWEVKK